MKYAGPFLILILNGVLEDEIVCSPWAPPEMTVMHSRVTKRIHVVYHGLN